MNGAQNCLGFFGVHPMSRTGNNMGSCLRELRQQGFFVRFIDIRRGATTDKQGGMFPRRDGLPANNLFVLLPQHRKVEPPLALGKGLKQKLDDSFFLYMLAH